MAAVLSPKALSFPHNILHDDRESNYTRMERQSPQRPSLPSISSLISDIAKQNENGTIQGSSNVSQQRIISPGSHATHPPTPERPNFGGSPKHGTPPTPPLPGASSFDFGGGRTPTIPCGSPMTPGNSQNGHSTQSPSTTNPEAYASHRSSYPLVPDMSLWHNPSSPPDSRRASREAVAELNSSSTGCSTYPELSGSSPTFSGLAQQRPLPVDFPPRVPATTPQMPQVDSQVSTQQYQHHHHYPVTSPSAYPQATDRYQCPTCQKAFSRPSSLKIHTYSHTGEKPFKCKYEGCGKYFSVRSNMKRHEKGCHGADTSSAGGSSPKAG